MGNNTKKLAILVVAFAFIAIVYTLPSYSNKEETIYPKLTEEILRTNSVLDETMTETGLYKDNKTYYFKGVVTNNYLNLNDELWRIISIDEYENITLIKQEGINNNKTYKYNEEYSNHKYENSIVEKELELYYKDKLSNVKAIIEQDYCVLYQDKCIETKRSKISIINPDTINKHNINKNEYNDESYLINGNDYWILNNTYDEYMMSALSGYISTLGNLDNGFVDEEKTIRPIITISSKSTGIGEGTIDNPYILAE